MSITRCQPLFGTYVSIEVFDAVKGHQIISDVFAQLQHIHNLFSFQSPTSWLTHFNCLGVHQVLYMPSHAYNVFKRALHLSVMSEGLFNPCVATELVKRKILPHHDLQLSECIWPFHHVIAMDKLGYVKKLKPCQLDFSGIAKGYGVDIATHYLKQHGITHGSVEAGGEIRVFGRGYTKPILVRLFDDSYRSLGNIENGALGTSSSKFGLPYGSDIINSHPVANPLSVSSFTVTIAARNCTIADALTKIVALTQRADHPLVQLYGSQGWYITTGSSRL